MGPNHRASLRLVDDKNGPTALHQIVNSGLPRSPEITALLVSAGADVDKKYDSTTGMSGRAPLAWALSETDDKELSEIALTDLLYNYQCALCNDFTRSPLRRSNGERRLHEQQNIYVFPRSGNSTATATFQRS